MRLSFVLPRHCFSRDPAIPMASDTKGSDAQDTLGIDASTAERFDPNDLESTKPLAETARVLDHHAEQALCRKFDYRLLPVLALMCTRQSKKCQVTVADRHL